MKVRDIMTEKPKCCEPGTNLGAAAELMWNNDCGVLPVIEDGKLAGIITDRDICIALGTRDKAAADTTVKDVASADVQTCAPEDDIHTAMASMRRAKVRRLPVVSAEGKLEGIVALNDIALAVDGKYGAIQYEEVIDTMKALSEHRGSQKEQPPKIKFPSIPVVVA